MCRTHDESAFHLFIRCHGVPYLWVLCKKAMKVRIAFVNQENLLSYRKVQDVQLTVLKARFRQPIITLLDMQLLKTLKEKVTRNQL